MDNSFRNDVFGIVGTKQVSFFNSSVRFSHKLPYHLLVSVYPGITNVSIKTNDLLGKYCVFDFIESFAINNFKVL